MLVKFEQNRFGPNFTKFLVFWQKMIDHFWQSVDAILEDVSVTEIFFDAKLLCYNARLSSFRVPKITVVRHVYSG